MLGVGLVAVSPAVQFASHRVFQAAAVLRRPSMLCSSYLCGCLCEVHACVCTCGEIQRATVICVYVHILLQTTSRLFQTTIIILRIPKLQTLKHCPGLCTLNPINPPQMLNPRGKKDATAGQGVETEMELQNPNSSSTMFFAGVDMAFNVVYFLDA